MYASVKLLQHAICMASLLSIAVGASASACTNTTADTDTIEHYYSGLKAHNEAACCAACTNDTKCNFAVFFRGKCYLKDTSTLTPKPKDGCTLITKRSQPPNAHPPRPVGPPPPPAPPEPLPPPKYKVVLAEHSPTPVISFANVKGQGNSPCKKTFNPSYVEVAGENKVGGVLLRTDGCAATKGSLSWAPCDVQTGVCGDVDPSYQISRSSGSQDPRAIFDKYSGYFYNFAYGGNWSVPDGCASSGSPGAPGACSVVLSRTKTPAVASSWEHVPGGTLPWHRNGCCWMQPVGQKSYCIFGESGTTGRNSGLGIAYTTDISTGKFTQTNWTGGVPGIDGVGLWMQALGAEQEEIKLEAGSHLVQLESGDFLHFYAAATPGWVANGNYTAGYIILDKDEPTKIIQRGSGQFMVPTYDYETLCGIQPGESGNTTCKYTTTQAVTGRRPFPIRSRR